MSLLYQHFPAFRKHSILRRKSLRGAAIIAILALGCREQNPVTPPDLLEISKISIDGGPSLLERGTRDTLTATALDPDGDTVTVPVVWRSSNERVARFERGGILIALDTGRTIIQASSLGVQSQGVEFVVVWFGPAHIDSAAFSVPNARGPGVTLSDSVRVRVINSDSAPVVNAKVAFTVTEGGGTVSPTTARTNQNGIAATQWMLGPLAGKNTVTASVVRADGTLDSLVADNLVSFTINSYNALTVQGGNNQTAQILAELPEPPSVKLIDSLGAPRPGVPVTFTVFANGRVTSPVVSTGVDGGASPGKWTLGDIPGQQLLEARVEDAKVTLQATATGTPILYMPAAVTAGGLATCSLESNGVVKCWGSEARIGTGDTSDISTPTAVKGSLMAASVVTGPTHTCALTSADEVWCWGINALVDTSGATTFAAEPTRVQSNIAWSRITPGLTHNCGIDLLENAYCWGANSGQNAGQLGDGTTVTRFAPTAVAGGFRFSRIAAGSNHTCGLTNGSAFCWGQNSAGQIGDGTTQARTTATAVTGNLTFESIGSGDGFSCAITAQPDGKVYCWGNISGVSQLTPSTYASAPPFVALSVGGGHACALTADATAYCWGGNGFGQLGDSSTTNRNAPTKVAGDRRFTQISAGLVHTCGITTAGAVACWGRNQAGELGEPTTTQFRITPRHVILGVNP